MSARRWWRRHWGFRRSRSWFDSLGSLRANGPAAAGTNHLALLVEEDIVVHHEQPFALDELVERAGLQRDDVAGACRNVVAPGLSGVGGAGAAHPVVGRRAGEHQEDMDRGRRDQPAIA